MKLKKLFALALAGVMALALLTGCGDKLGDKSDDTLRAEALADIINVRYGKNITCEADPQLSEAAEKYTQVSSEDGRTLLINKLKLGNYHSIGSEPRTALLNTIGIAPGTANDDTLLYGVEVKFYNMEVELDEHLESCHKGLYIIGDGSGVTHSLSHASAGGVFVAREILAH